MAEAPQRIRLHISPFNPTLLPAIIPASVQSTASGLSYHTVPTFPENDYGYIELPAAAASQIKKKLNGYFLKGMKMKIEEARPDKKRKSQQAELADGRADVAETTPKRPRKEKRVKEQGVFPGVQLPEGREVKRGWTQPKESEKKSRKHGEGKSKEKKSKDHADQELLFKTHLPANVSSKTSDKEKKKHKSTRKPGRDAEVKEFTQSTKYPAFLRDPKGSNGTAQAVEFVDGRGWVDGEGNVVEPVVQTRSTRRRNVTSSEESGKQSAIVQDEEAEATPEGEKSAAEEESDVSEVEDVQPEALASIANATETAKNSSVDAQDDDSDDDSIEEEVEEVKDTIMTAPEEASDAEPSSSAEPDGSEAEDDDDDEDGDEEAKSTNALPAASPSDLTTPAATSTTALPAPVALATTEPLSSLPLPDLPKAIHPLEALYKRSTAPSASTSTMPIDRTPNKPSPIQTTFSFFNTVGGDDEQDGEDANDVGARELMPPRTPFTQRDFESRGMRSAAPTPDTAAIGKRFAWNVEGGDDEDDDDDEQEEEDDEDEDDEQDDEDAAGAVNRGEAVQANTEVSIPGAAAPDDAPAEQTEFEKHFWAMRGEYNRSWKARKREARKEQRQSENRRTGFGR